MGDGSLSQDEIDALLQGADDMLAPSGPSAGEAGRGRGIFPPAELNAIRDALNAAVSAVAPSLSGYLGGRNLRISRPFIEAKTQDAVRADFPGRYVQVSMDFSGALNGRNLIVYNWNDAGTISSLMMGDERGAPPADLSEARFGKIRGRSAAFIPHHERRDGAGVVPIIHDKITAVQRAAEIHGDLNVTAGKIGANRVLGFRLDEGARDPEVPSAEVA